MKLTFILVYIKLIKGRNDWDFNADQGTPIREILRVKEVQQQIIHL